LYRCKLHLSLYRNNKDCVWNRVLRRIFGAKRLQITGCWRKLHNEESHTFTKWYYDDQNKDDMGRAYRMHRSIGTVHRFWVGKLK
jgi:hypothetical protein